MTIYHVTLLARSSGNARVEEYRAGKDFVDVLLLLAIQYGYANIEEFEVDWLVLWEEI